MPRTHHQRPALEAFLPEGHWEETGAEAFCLGAGGSSIAITSYLMEARHGRNRPSRIVVSNRSLPRLEELKAIHAEAGLPASDRIPSHAPPGGERRLAEPSQAALAGDECHRPGQGRPGSPITAGGLFPAGGFAWDFNYRGNLLFLDQAHAQAAARQLAVEDGWVYFLHGWTRVIAKVFDVDIPTRGDRFEEISRIAREAR